ncbi:MAG: hypothetical protein PHW47_13040, partial [Lachnospira sp.]|nr:hypothetical protein [Lachnospira sp.]
KNAINIPYDSFIQILECGRNRLYNSDRFMREGDDIYFERIMSILRERTKTFVIYCDRGAMSMVVCNKMSRMGYVTKTVVGGFNKYNGRYKEFGKL